MANSRCPFLRTQIVFSLGIIISALGGVLSFDVTVLHTNDVRARFDPIRAKRGAECTDEMNANGECYGGLARRVTKIQEIRNSTENVLLLDAGHQFQGSMWFYVYKGEATANFMNKLSYDAMALGQHEFDLKVEGLATFLRSASFPAIASNIDITKEPSLNGLLLQYHIVNFTTGEQVGIVGYSYEDTPDSVDTGDLIFSEEIQGLQTAVDCLMSMGVNKIIALGNSGYEKARDIADQLVGVDVVVSGRDFTLLHTGDKPSTETPKDDYPVVIHPTRDSSATVLVVQAYAYGKYVGHLDVSFDDEGAVSGFGGNTILLDDSVEEDAATLQEMKPWRDHVNEVANQVVGKTFVPLMLSECATRECAIGNLIADAMLFPHMNGTMRWSDVSIALTTTGSIGSSIKAGDITIGTLNKVLPYGDSIDVIELYGRHLKEALEHSVYELDEGKTNYQMLQVSGIRVSYDLNRTPGKRVLSAYVRCSDCKVPDYQPLLVDTVYKVAINNYVGSGNYGYSSLRDNKMNVRKGDLDVDILIDYLHNRSPICHDVELGRQWMYRGDAPCFDILQ
ncbi:snake venom 5'-nucleotidase-like [Asterias rubens]|uniref:snake venom 5'-nucleotidase-like n=1 Tax=Asterias rubens TaxID=7604 RepID=UPI001455015A|nr:snake venom 5'-nucleotidase-like [Asterias rubens]